MYDLFVNLVAKTRKRFYIAHHRHVPSASVVENHLHTVPFTGHVVRNKSTYDRFIIRCVRHSKCPDFKSDFQIVCNPISSLTIR